MFPFPQAMLCGVGVGKNRWNPAHIGSSVALSNGNATMNAIGAATGSALATNGKAAGKWYAEAAVGFGGTGARIGLSDTSTNFDNLIGFDAHSISYELAGGVNQNGGGVASYASYAGGDVIGIAINATAKTVWFSKNGVWQAGSPSAGTGGISYTATNPVFLAASSSGGVSWTIHSTLTYSLPTGFTAL